MLQAPVCIIHTRWCDRFVHRVAFVASKLFSPLIAQPPHRTTVVLYCTATLQQDNKSQLINKTHVDDVVLCNTAVIVFPSTRNPCSTTRQSGRSDVSVKIGETKCSECLVSCRGHFRCDCKIFEAFCHKYVKKNTFMTRLRVSACTDHYAANVTKAVKIKQYTVPL